MESGSRANKAAPKTYKLRASCNACNEAKVRCSQMRPSCARCLKKEIYCMYGISQRSGKHNAEAYNAMRRNAANRPPTPPMMTDAEIPSSSSILSTRELQSPQFLLQDADQDLSKQLLTDWAIDNTFITNEDCLLKEMAFSLSDPSLFGRNELHSSNLQKQQRFPSPRQVEHRHAVHETRKLHSHGQLSEANSQDSRISGISDANIVRGQQGANPETELQDSCIPCSTNHNVDSSTNSLDSCCCIETAVTHMASLPILLHTKPCEFDVELVQFREAIDLCNSVLACECAGKNSTSILSTGMLIAGIIYVLERVTDKASQGDYTLNGSNNKVCNRPSSSRTPKFQVGIYQLDEEDERKLKQEVWWLQMKKIDSLIVGFKDMVSKVRPRQDLTQVTAWERLINLLDLKTQEIKRDWTESMKKPLH